MPSLMESIISLDVGAQEPWPSDVQLFQPYPMEQILLPDNANCLATQAYLHMCGLPFKIEHRANAEFMSPSGKVPFIKCGAFVVSELEPIVQFVANKGISLTEDFDNEQKSDLRAYMSLIFSVLMNAELYICWCDKRTYNEVTKVRNGSVYPWPLNHYQNWTKRSAVVKKLKLLNWYQKTLGSVYQEVETCCQALSERLEGKEYFFGSKPTEVDALLYGHTFSICSNPVDFPHLFVIFQRFPNLIIHCRRICFNYTFLRYIDFTKKDTDIESSRDSSAHSLHERPKDSLFTHLWNFFTLKVCKPDSNDTVLDNNCSMHDNESKASRISVARLSGNEISFKPVQLKSAFEEDELPKSINYLGHKVIQQHLQQDLRNKLSDFTIDTNSDLWSEKDVCYVISDRDLIRANNADEVDLYEGDGDDDTTKQIITNLEMEYTHCSGGSNSTISNISEQLDWVHHSSSSVHFSNNKCDLLDSFTENKNDTLNDQDTIPVDVEVESGLAPKFSNCSIDGDLDWLHDFSKDDPLEKGDGITYDEKHIKDSLHLNELSEITALEGKPSKTLLTIASNVESDVASNVSKPSNTSNAWSTFESASVSRDSLTIPNMDSTLNLMNDMISSVEQMVDYPSCETTEDSKLENYSENHICDEYCDNIYIANDDLFWENEICKSVSECDDKSRKLTIEQNSIKRDASNDNITKTVDIEIGSQTKKVVEKISNESLKKYFSCESYRQAAQLENYMSRSKCASSASRSSVIEECPLDQPYPQNEFFKLLTSDYDFINRSNPESNCALVLRNDENRNSPSKPRVFRKCRRLLNRVGDTSATPVSSDSKIVQMYNEKLLECRNNPMIDAENIRAACTVLKNFNANCKPEQCGACNLYKFSSSPSISQTCKCCDDNFKFKSKSKSVNMFATAAASPVQFTIDKFSKL